MLELAPLIKGHAASDIVSAFYYVARYLKQAAHILEYYKDIFEDEERSAPSKETKDLALSIISEIERSEGTSIVNLKHGRVIALITEITEIEQGLEPQYTLAEIEAGSSALKALEDPPIV
jgi:hypothetical protein